MKEKGLVVLSLFDGISCGQLALQRAGVKVEKYYASEIDRNAIEITQKNFPETIQLGDVTRWKEWNIEKPDLIMGGSPCQGFSINGKMLNFEDARSKLLFEFVKTRDYYKPNFWLLENVATMKKEVKEAIDNLVGVEGILINSNIFSAQNRKRYYWTNIPFKMVTKESPLKIKDILEQEGDFVFKKKEFIQSQKINPSETNGAITINPKKPDGKQTSQWARVYDVNGRMVSLTAELGNRFWIYLPSGGIRKLTVRELARLQTIPDSYSFNVVSDFQAAKAIGNGWTVDVIVHILKGLKS